MRTYLNIDGDYVRYESKADAIESFARTARELDRFGQHIEASLHYPTQDHKVHDYPDYVLSLGPRGGIRCEKA